jgi:integrase
VKNKSASHARQFANSLAMYAVGLANKPVNAITTEDVRGVLKPIWNEKPETARRVRNRIERILDAATAEGHRVGDNPATAKLLGHLLGDQKKTDKHHAALAYGDVPGFVAKLRKRGDAGAAALEFVILTATRLGETVDATWGEFDLAARLWVIPAERMKAGKEHAIPLSARTCQILADMEKARAGDRVFAVSPRTVQNIARGLDEKATVHGFRSSFRDWAGDKTSFEREICEAALAHSVGDETERAYRRGTALDRRREMMDAWAGYVEGAKGAEIVELASRRA